MGAEENRALETSNDRKELVHAAQVLASSPQTADHRDLAQFLRSEGFLDSLDSEDDYRGRTQRLRIYRVLRTLGKNPEPSARSLMLLLMSDDAFLAEPARIDALVLVSAGIHPIEPQLIRFWDAYSQPEDGHGNLTIEALLENGSREGYELLATKLADPEQDPEDKHCWIFGSIFPRRNQNLLLQACKGMLKARLPTEPQSWLVDALFDYKPETWFRPATFRPAPPAESYSPDARRELREIGELALASLELTKRQRTVITETVKRLSEEDR